MKPHVLKFSSLESTNQKARSLAAEGAPIGTIVVAEKQTAGRGRGAHTWHSPEGGLYFSILLASNPNRPITDLSFLGGVAVAQSIKECLPKIYEVGVKWPNDCLLQGKKVAGVLGEAVGAGGLSVLGIGVNVNLSEEDLKPFHTNAFSATSFLCETGGPMDIDAVLRMLTQKLFNLYEVYKTDGFGPIRTWWEQSCPFLGKPIHFAPGATYRESSQMSTSTAAMTGSCLGIDDSGAIVLSTPTGERRFVYAGELTCS